ncbi:MAG: hypothetical protein KGJ99_04050 [Betaproteobacteria bacterium]|nr:hypothetical protein [Betaproteobacteria bacterium]
MFAFLTPGVRGGADPMASAKSAAAWLTDLPSLDIVARQQLVLRAFDGMRQSPRPFDAARVQAVLHVDAALGGDRRKLFKQYVETLDSTPKVAERVWQASFDLAQAFIGAYQTAIETALVPSSYARWKPQLPVLFARLIHYYGTDAKLRVSRHEHWIPAKWVELHRAYLRATELGLERVPTQPGSVAGAGTQWTIEQEYVYVLLVHQLNTGNLSAGNLDWVLTQFRAWSRRLELVAMPKSMEGFFIDVAGRTGLVRRTGQDSGAMLRYLDTTPLCDQLDMTLAALRHSEATDQGPVSAVNQQRGMILEKARPAIAPNLNLDMRRDPRISCIHAARVRIGLARILKELSTQESAGTAEAQIEDTRSGEQIEVYAVAGAARSQQRASSESDTLSVSLAQFPESLWQVKDRSVAGLRICASGGVGQTLMLGALAAVRESIRRQWALGVVRRVNKMSNDEVEAGLSVIAERVVAVGLYTLRGSRDNLGIEVNGVDALSLGPRFDGLYLPPPSRPDKPLTVKSVIIPTPEYAEGRKLILATSHSIYTVALRQLVEQRADWSWVAIQVVDKRARN